MLHPIFSVIISRPQLFIEHVAGYAALAHEEASEIGVELAMRAIAWAIAALCFALFLGLAGVAFMLGAVNDEAHWMLFAVPGSVLLLAILSFVYARKPLTPHPFKDLKAQVDADARALRAAGDAP